MYEQKKSLCYMGQKAHPIALRQASNYRHQDTVWYSRRYRQQLAARDQAYIKYMEHVHAQQQLPAPRLAMQHGPHGTYIYGFMCTPHTNREHMATLCYMPYTSPMSLSTGGNSMWGYQNMCMPFNTSGRMPYLSGISENTLYQWAGSCIHTMNPMEYLVAHVVNASVPVPVSTSESRAPQWLMEHMANHMERGFHAPVYWTPIGVTQVWHDAGFVADEIVWFLERRVGFRRIKQALQRLVESMPSIQGVRVAVSGRVGGRSKKSQRARCDVWKYGATPLHVFSQHIDYAQRIARTPLGTSGVSVWLVYRESL